MRAWMITTGAVGVLLAAGVGARAFVLAPANADLPLGPAVRVQPTLVQPTSAGSAATVTPDRPAPSGGVSGSPRVTAASPRPTDWVETVGPLPAQSLDDHGGLRGDDELRGDDDVSGSASGKGGGSGSSGRHGGGDDGIAGGAAHGGSGRP